MNETFELLLAAKVREIAFLHQQRARSKAFKEWFDEIESSHNNKKQLFGTKKPDEAQQDSTCLTQDKRVDFLEEWDKKNPVENFVHHAISELSTYSHLIRDFLESQRPSIISDEPR
ncbi:hypothetical protein [Rhodoferax mekongensis]|uniref:hypothetical protein n=1 Tax=Rhodoferax mekongensis TaxID=3068341 RepID=UPI0028BD50DF|nr:hypothetical protein [Rhodoferax sp. TBRC 17199]MDT7515388.1 hypothetical protein [Rhodoferax sp. TBRC 17199]